MKRRSLVDHAARLRRAIARAVAEHGSPNTFSFTELHTHHGGPPPLIAGRVARRMADVKVLASGRVSA